MITLTGTYIASVTLAGVVDGFVAAQSLDPDAVTLIAAMNVEPDATRQTLISDTIVALKAEGIWEELDECWFMAAHDAQAGLLGWKRYRDLTAVNAPTFTVDEGYAGNGTTSYLNTNFVPSTDGVQYTLNDASFGMYSRTNVAAAVDDMGADNGAITLFSRIRMHSGSAASDAINFGVPTGQLASATTNSLGLHVVRRTASNAIGHYRNGSQLGTGSTASAALLAVPYFVGARNSNGTPSSFTARQYAFAFVGASLSTGQQASLFTITEVYLDAIGAGVVS